MRHFSFLFFVLFFIATTADAEIIIGRVIDAQTHEPLEDASVTVMTQTEICVTGTQVLTDSLGRFCTGQTDEGLSKLEFAFIGYYSQRKSLRTVSGKDTIVLGDILLRPSEILLKAAEVKARIKRFIMHGDTVIFNPDAFHLDKGVRLEELLKKLPGVKMQDGKLTWMNKPVRILMNGEEMFGDNNFLITRLPAEAVNRIKAYNKASDQAKRTGRDDGKEDHVLDIMVKPGWLDRWYGDFTGVAQTAGHYDASLDAYRLSNANPLMAYGRINNVAKMTSNREFGGYSMSGTGGFGKEQFASLGYKHQWKGVKGKKDSKSYYYFNVEGGHDDARNNRYQNMETFLPGAARTYSLTEDLHRSCTYRMPLVAGLRLDLDSFNTFTANFKFNASKTHSDGDNHSATFDSSPYTLDSDPLGRTFRALSDDLWMNHVINRSRNHSASDDHRSETNMNVSYSHFFRDESELILSSRLLYQQRDIKSYNHRDLRYYRDAATNSFVNQYASSPDHCLEVNLGTAYSRWLNKHVRLAGEYNFTNTHIYKRRDFYRLDRLADWNNPETALLGNHPTESDSLLKAWDSGNSMEQRLNTRTHQLSLSSTIDLKPFSLMPSLDYTFRHEYLNYRSSKIDTTATRNANILAPRFTARLKVSKTSILQGSFSYNIYYPELITTIGYRDDTDPLNIYEGNPSLRRYFSHRTAISYSGNFMKHEQSVYVELSYDKNIHTPWSVTYYNPKTGVYRTHDENGRGGNNYGLNFSFDQGLGGAFRFRNNFQGNLRTAYGYLTTIEEGSPLRINRLRNTQFTEEPTVSYSTDHVDASIFGSLDYQHLTYSEASKNNTSLYEYNYGVRAEYRFLPFSVSTKMTIVGNRGYATSRMNRARCLWNAIASMTVLGNKGQLSLEWNDILNKDFFYYSSEQANSRTEYWSTQLHHYLRLTFTYHFDAKKKD